MKQGQLTERQKKFARLLALGELSQRECADAAGYRGTQQAAHNLASKPAIQAEVARLTAARDARKAAAAVPVPGAPPPPAVDLVAEAEKAVRLAKSPSAHLRALCLLASLTRFGTGDKANIRKADDRSVRASGGAGGGGGGGGGGAAARAAQREEWQAIEDRLAADGELLAELHNAECTRATDEEVRASCREMGCYTDAEIEVEVQRERDRVLSPPRIGTNPDDGAETRQRVVQLVRDQIK
jgi:hypothetical protein